MPTVARQHSLVADALPIYGDGFPIIPLRRKVPVSSWKRLQVERPGLPETVAAMCDPRIDGFAVPHWNGLICRDYDERASYDRWRKSHESLAVQLPTVCTSRGMRVYATAPAAGYVSHAKLGDGELIARNNHYSVLPHSRHPDGTTYTWVNPWRWPMPEVDPVECGFIPNSLPELQRGVPYPSCGGDAPEWIWDTSDLSGPTASGFPSTEAINFAIAKTLPQKVGQRDLKVLELVRALRRAGVSSLEEGVVHLRQWWNLALSVIGTRPYDVTHRAFCRAWDNFDPTLDRLQLAIVRARFASPPAEVQGVYKDPMLSLATLCRELQRVVGPAVPFILSRYDAARATGIAHPKQAGRYLEMMRGDGLLKRTHPGFTHRNPALRKAAKWMWVGTM